MQLLLPTDAQAEMGYLIGWNPHSFMCTVCAVIDSSTTTLDELQKTLLSLASSPALSELSTHCGGPPSLLGVLLPRGGDVDVTLHPLAEAAELWLTLDAGVDGPSLRAVHCCGCRHRAPLQLILYQRGQHEGEWCSRASLHDLWDSAAIRCECDGGPSSLSRLAMSIRHVCCSGEWQRALHSQLGRFSPRCHHGRSKLRLGLAFCAPVAVALRVLASFWLWLLRFEVLPAIAPCRWSYAARHAEARIVRAAAWPHRWRAAQATPLWRPGARLERLHMYGELTCALIDSFLGCCLAAMIVSWRVEICAVVGQVHAAIHEEQLPGLVHWLMGVDPGGFKLNENLNVALGTCVVSLLQAWNVAASRLVAQLPPPSVSLLALLPATCLGASVGVALLSDLLLASILHLRLLYTTIRSVYYWYNCALYALFNLFRGTKYNAEKQRVETCEYDTEQLLLGTLFFTILTFLFPTVLAYYLLAAVLWIAVLAMHSALLMLLLVLDDWPWLEMLQLLASPGSLHTGVRFKPLPPSSLQRGASVAVPPSNRDVSASSSRFTLDQPVASITPCFRRHGAVISTLLRHCSAMELVLCLLLGRHPLPTAERDVLLAQPPDRSSHQRQAHTFGDFWALLREGVVG